MTNQPDGVAILMIGPEFPDILVENGGIFPGDEMIHKSYAAWYAAKNAHQALYRIEGQVTLEGEKDIDVKLRDVVEGSIKPYGIEDINDVMLLMPYCRRWAFKRGVIWNPKFQAWLDSGGRAYNEVTRDPDKI